MNEIFINLGESFLTLFPILLAILIFGILIFIAKWRIYKKGGQPGWATLIPFYSTYAHIRVANLPVWTFILALTPFIAILKVILWYETARNFGKSKGYGVAINILGFILIPVLGFGKSQYNSENNEVTNNTTNTVPPVNTYDSIQELDNNFTGVQPTAQVDTTESVNIFQEKENINNLMEPSIEMTSSQNDFPIFNEQDINTIANEQNETDKQSSLGLFNMDFAPVNNLESASTDVVNNNNDVMTNNTIEETAESFELPKTESIDDLLSTIGSANNENVESLFSNNESINQTEDFNINTPVVEENTELNIDDITPDVIIPTSDNTNEENNVEELNNNLNVEIPTDVNENTEQTTENFELPKTESIEELLSTINVATDNNEVKEVENVSEFDIQDLSNNNEFDYNSANDQINNLNIPVIEETTEESNELNNEVEDITPNVIIPTSDIVLEEDNTNDINNNIVDFDIELPSDLTEDNNNTESNINTTDEIIENITPDIIIPSSDTTVEENRNETIDNNIMDFNIPLPTDIIDENNDDTSNESGSSIVMEPIKEDIETDVAIPTNNNVEENTTEDINFDIATPSSDIILEENNNETIDNSIMDFNIPLPTDIIEENNGDSSNESGSSIVMEPIKENEIIEDINPDVTIPSSNIVLKEDNNNEINNNIMDLNIPTLDENIEENNISNENSNIQETNESNNLNTNDEILNFNMPVTSDTSEENSNDNLLNSEMIIPSLEETIELPIIGENSFENAINIEELKENTSDINTPKEKFNINDLLASPESETNNNEESNISANPITHNDDVEDGFKTCNNCGTKNIADAPLCFLCGKAFE